MTTLTGYTNAPRVGGIAQPLARERAVAIALWIVRIAAAGLFLFAGTLKLAGAAPTVQMFNLIGFGQWFRYLTGSIEVVGGVLLLTPFAFFGAIALAVTMVGAVLTHLLIVGGSPTPAVVLLAMTTFVAWSRRR